jgi:hypothetical protein
MNPKNAKYKSETQKDVTYAEGGSDHMFGEQQAEPQTPAHTGQEDTKGPGAKYAEGGKGKMFGYNPSVPAKAGITSAR